MSDELKTELAQIFKILSQNPNLRYFDNGQVSIKTTSGSNLFQLTKTKIQTPLPSFDFQHLSPLTDCFVKQEDLKAFITNLTNTKAIIGLNHLGVCYKVNSQEEERQRLKQETSKTALSIYELTSNDKGLWLFIGDVSVWSDPLFEFLPVEDINDKWVDYWLPHFQIDIDTNLSCEEIEVIVFKTFNNSIKPFRITAIDNIVYTVRIRLGIISGVNINLDISTKNRQVKYTREKLLQKLN